MPESFTMQTIFPTALMQALETAIAGLVDQLPVDDYYPGYSKPYFKIPDFCISQ